MRNGPTNLTSGLRANSILLLAKRINCLMRVSTPLIPHACSLVELLMKRRMAKTSADRPKNIEVSPNEKSVSDLLISMKIFNS